MLFISIQKSVQFIVFKLLYQSSINILFRLSCVVFLCIPRPFHQKKVVSLSLFFHSKTFLQSTLIWDFFLKIGENLRSVWIVSTLTFSILSSTSSMVCCVNTSYKSIYIQHMSCYSKERKTNFYFKGREKWRNIRKPQCM